GERVVVKDHQPNTGGIFINNQRVTEDELRPGDVLRVGNSYLRLELDDGSRPAEEKQPAEEKPRGLPILSAERLDELVGHPFGHFKIVEVLGRGHCGMVFRAADQKAGHDVALKILPTDFPRSEAEMQRFARVLKEALPLRHAHLVTVLGAGKTGPYCWIAREYIAGKSAALAVERAGGSGKVNWKEALRIAAHVARALEFIHGRR